MRKIVLYMTAIICCLLFMSCAAPSAISRYDGASYPATEQYEVKVFHSETWAKKYHDEKLDERFILIGSSGFSVHDNIASYGVQQMRDDCMRVGADVMIVVDRETVATEQRNWSYQYQSPAATNVSFNDRYGNTVGTARVNYSQTNTTSGSTTHTWTGFHAYFFKDEKSVETYEKYREFWDDPEISIKKCCSENYGDNEWVLSNCIETAKRNTHHQCAYKGSIGNF